MNSAFGLAIAGIMILFAVCFILNNSVLFKKAFVLSLAVLVCFCSAQLFVNQNCAEIYISDCGAVVVSYNDVTVVSGITNSSSYYEAYSYLFAKSKNIDYLIVNDGESYNVSLTQNVYTNTLLTDDFVDCILENGRYEHIEVLDDYSVSLADDFDLYYHKGAYLLEINGCTFSSGTQGKDSTVALLNDYDIVKDLHGVAELSDGDLIYTFSGANTFSVRRINVW
jgi:hypothetical protein